MRKRLSAVIAAVILLIGIAAVSVRYYLFVSQTIYLESVSHLTEIFQQTNRSLYHLVGRTGRICTCGPTIYRMFRMKIRFGILLPMPRRKRVLPTSISSPVKAIIEQ